MWNILGSCWIGAAFSSYSPGFSACYLVCVILSWISVVASPMFVLFGTISCSPVHAGGLLYSTRISFSNPIGTAVPTLFSLGVDSAQPTSVTQMLNEADLGLTATDILNQDYQKRSLQWKPATLSKDEMPVVVAEIPVAEKEENVLWKDLHKPRGTGEIVVFRDYLESGPPEPSAVTIQPFPAVLEQSEEAGVRVAENRGEAREDRDETVVIVKPMPEMGEENVETENLDEGNVELGNLEDERMDSERQTEEASETPDEQSVIVVEFDRTEREDPETAGNAVQTAEQGNREEKEEKEEKEEGEKEGENLNQSEASGPAKSKKELRKERKEQRKKEKRERNAAKSVRNPKESVIVDSFVITVPEFGCVWRRELTGRGNHGISEMQQRRQQQSQTQQQQQQQQLDDSFVDLSAQMMHYTDQMHVEEVEEGGNVHVTTLG